MWDEAGFGVEREGVEVHGAAGESCGEVLGVGEVGDVVEEFACDAAAEELRVYVHDAERDVCGSGVVEA